MKKIDIQRLVRPNIQAMRPYSSARDEFTKWDAEMVFLDANENPFSTTVNRYPDPKQMALKSILGKIKGANVDQILLGNGSDEILDLVVRAFCEPKIDNVITLPPTYGMYGVIAATNDVENKEVLLTSNFQPNVEAILAEIEATTKIIFLCSPNNPTGTSFSESEVEKILISFNGLVVIDEAYIDFSAQKSWLNRLEEFPNLVITQTLSKAYGMAGIRIGICYASAQIIEVLNRIKPPYNINKLSQEYAIDALSVNEYSLRKISSIISNKSILLKAMVQIKFIKNVYSSDANFVLIEVDDATLRYDQLLKKGIVVRNRSAQPLCENTLRISIGTTQENEQLIKALNSI